MQLAQVNTAAALQSQIEDRPVVRLMARSGWRALRLGELWHSRELLFFLAWRDIKVRYKQTIFGAAWAIIQPLMMMLVFTVFVGKMVGAGKSSIPYPLFVYSGILPWTFFSTAVSSAGNSVVASERLVTKIYFPRILIPLAAGGTALVDFVIAMGLLAILMCVYHIWGGMQMLLVPVVVGIIALTSMGIGTLVAAVCVRYRDVKYVLPFVLQIGLFATQNIYYPNAFQGHISALQQVARIANPMTGLITAFRAACLGGEIPWASTALAAAMGISLFLFGVVYFQRVEDRFADEI
jgi:homopolymeric O-antigen transport system permease protein